MKPPQIGIIYIERIPEEYFLEFKNIVFHENLDFRIESRTNDAVYAGLEWLLPTAVVVFLAKSYFDGFLREMGKEHYKSLKKGMKLLKRKLLGNKKVNITLISTQGKVREDNPYSNILSIYAEADRGQKFKLLIQNGISDSEYDELIDAFLRFVEAYHERTLDSSILDEMANTKMVSRTLLLIFNNSKKVIEPISPVPEK
jgi:hypothetical protein